MTFNRSALIKLAAAGTVMAAALFGATAASAGPNWSVGIDLPGVAIGVAQPGYYEPAPVYMPPPTYYRPAPPVYYRPPPPAYYAPAPIYYEPGWRGDRHEGRRFHRDWDGNRHDRREWDRRGDRRDGHHGRD